MKLFPDLLLWRICMYARTHTHLPVISVGCWLSIVKWDGEQDGGIKGGGRSPTAVQCQHAEKNRIEVLG